MGVPRHTVYIGLGGNLGEPAAVLRRGLEALGALHGVCIERRSRLYRSAPLGCGAPQPDYLNAVCRARTSLEPAALLAALHRIEAAAGRRRRDRRNAPRTLDLDLLLYGERRLSGVALSVPHPRLGERRFVLEPLHEIAPGLVVPGQGAVAALLEAVREQRCEPLDEHRGAAAGHLQ